jgi:signal peptidase I
MLRLLKVTGNSLSPRFQEGDFVIVSKIPFLFSPPKPGDVVAFRQPGYGTLIKLVEGVDKAGGGLTVTGSQPDSVDSRVFGSVSIPSLVGKVIVHVTKPR